jgi:hypothetical protein
MPRSGDSNGTLAFQIARHDSSERIAIPNDRPHGNTCTLCRQMKLRLLYTSKELLLEMWCDIDAKACMYFSRISIIQMIQMLFSHAFFLSWCSSFVPITWYPNIGGIWLCGFAIMGDSCPRICTSGVVLSPHTQAHHRLHDAIPGDMRVVTGEQFSGRCRALSSLFGRWLALPLFFV